MHSPGKRNTQKIERKHLTLRTRIKRLVRKTICFSKTIQMHDIVIGLFVNRYADRKSTRLNSSHGYISYAVFCLKKKKKQPNTSRQARRTNDGIHVMLT